MIFVWRTCSPHQISHCLCELCLEVLLGDRDLEQGQLLALWSGKSPGIGKTETASGGSIMVGMDLLLHGQPCQRMPLFGPIDSEKTLGND